MTTDPRLAAGPRLAELGPNAGLIDEMYRLFRENPNAVSAGWREFFADYQPRAEVVRRPRRRRHPPPPPPPRPRPSPTARRAPVTLDGETPQPLRGASARIVENMEASLGVPTATSVRTLPGQAARDQPPDPEQPARARPRRQGQLHAPHRLRRRARAADACRT